MNTVAQHRLANTNKTYTNTKLECKHRDMVMPIVFANHIGCWNFVSMLPRDELAICAYDLKFTIGKDLWIRLRTLLFISAKSAGSHWLKMRLKNFNRWKLNVEDACIQLQIMQIIQEHNTSPVQRITEESEIVDVRIRSGPFSTHKSHHIFIFMQLWRLV